MTMYIPHTQIHTFISNSTYLQQLFTNNTIFDTDMAHPKHLIFTYSYFFSPPIHFSCVIVFPVLSISRSTAIPYLRTEYLIDDMITNCLVSSLSGCPRQETKRDSRPDEEATREGCACGQNIPVAVPHKLHPAQHCLLGPVWRPRPLVIVHIGQL